MADEIDYKIHADDMQLVELELDSGLAIRHRNFANRFQVAEKIECRQR